MPRTAPGTPRLGNASERDEATNGSDTEAQSSTVCPVCENIILDAGQTKLARMLFTAKGDARNGSTVAAPVSRNTCSLT